MKIKEQDQCLEVLNDSLIRIDDIAHNIHDNIEEQGNLIDDVDREVGLAQWGVDTATTRIGKILKTDSIYSYYDNYNNYRSLSNLGCYINVLCNDRIVYISNYLIFSLFV